ncbi:uncharacterized protein LOC129721324 [Wyeomyia smithii]|uniref:uncharacterized protein LOC129721324 n=1 Tax=Wyeomyia smithii TaxID=174621 RepID=UPI00246816CE|nr:uncharacterized protein LOC129721324 [Wyeomyia smithii]XP_055529739.1 uncharacterized protein LOC129721324 [Wyeomyia smithii]
MKSVKKPGGERALPDRIPLSSMEPIVRDGKIREQIELENKVRREYPKKWGFITQPEVTEYMNLKKNNQRLKEIQQQKGQKVNLREYDGHGESYFLSKQMFKTLLDTCRCGRKKVANVHALKCLEKPKSIYEKTDDEEEEEAKQEPAKKDDSGENNTSYIPKVPVLSSGMYGWPQNRFVAMERTTYYISPRYTMPGYPIVDCQPYHNIILG